VPRRTSEQPAGHRVGAPPSVPRRPVAALRAAGPRVSMRCSTRRSSTSRCRACRPASAPGRASWCGCLRYLLALRT
jgi:hypothetical protein